MTALAQSRWLDSGVGGWTTAQTRERERAIKRLKRFTGPEEKGWETVMLIMCARQTPRVREKERYLATEYLSFWLTFLTNRFRDHKGKEKKPLYSHHSKSMRHHCVSGMRESEEWVVCFWACIMCVFLSDLLLWHPLAWIINSDQLLL